VHVVHGATAVIDMKHGTLTGKANGVITVYGVDGSVLEGTYQYIIRADFSIDEAGNIIYENVTDDGVWQLQGVSGTFSGERATGTLRASLFPVGPTLDGVMSLNGIHKN
ncbi:MAG: hypothetical protein PHE50_09885, partial [Dehalococcoidales bacterium]|nr:hypothetical protein [Dehalococcoidales bacterium]